jgi:hypothetical protein
VKPIAPAQLFERYGVDPKVLQWTGRPRKGVVLRSGDWIVVPVALVFVVCILLPVAAMLQTQGPGAWILQLIALVFLTLVLLVFFGRFFWDAYKRGGTYYGLTSDSALILRQGLGAGLQRVFLPTVPAINFTPSSSGGGTIFFGNSTPWYSRLDLSTESSVPAFEVIPDGWRVYQLCLSAQHQPHAQALLTT